MSTVPKRKNATSTPEKGRKQRTNNPTINQDDHEPVSLLTGGPIRNKSSSSSSLHNQHSHTTISTQLTRAQEQEWLTSLNRRLEIITLMRHAQEQATINQIADNNVDLNDFKQELTTIAKTYASVLAQQQTHITELSQSSSTSNVQLHDLQTENQALIAQIAQIQSEKKNIEKDYRTMKIKHTTLESQLESSNERVQTLDDELSRVMDEKEDLIQQLNDDGDNDNNPKSKRKSTKSDQIAKITALETNVKFLEKQLEVERQHYKNEIDAAKQRMKSLGNEKEDIIQQMEDEFQTRLENAIDEQQYENEKQLEQLSKQLQKQNDVTIKRITDQLEQTKEQLQSINNIKTQLEEQITTLRTDNITLETLNDAYEIETTRLREQITQINNENTQIINQFEQEIEELVLLFEDKEQSFDELMKIKVSLAMEIDQYRKLLEGEENRISNPTSTSTTITSTPTRRVSSRRKTDAATTTAPTPAASTTKKRTTNDKLSSLIQTGIDLNGKYIKFHNGSTSPIKFNNYTIRSDLTDEEYTFEDAAPILPNETIMIFFTKPTKSDSTKGVKHIYDLHQEEIFDQNDSNDKRGQLYDNLGRSIAKFEFLHKGRNTKNRK